MVFHKHVFRLQITVNNPQFLQEGKRSQQLNGKGTNIMNIQRSEVIGFEKLVKISGKHLCYYADVFPKDDKVLYPQQIFTVLDVLLLDLHQDIDLVQSQLHMFPARPDDLHSHRFPRLMIKGLNHLPESTPAQSFQQLVSIPNLLVLLPEVPALEVVLAHPTPDPYVVDSLFVDELDSLVFRKHRLEALEDLLPGKARQ